MAQTTSARWKELIAKTGTLREYQFDINGLVYSKDAEISHSVETMLFEEFGIGNAVSSQLSLTIFADNIPRGATIKRSVRLTYESQVSEWIPKGVFFTNTRASEDGVWTIEAFDAMRKADVVWTPDDALEFPMTMPDVVNLFCGMMGVELDERTILNSEYTIDYPANEMTVRNELCYIAASHGGNWIITDEGKLYLVPLRSAPPDSNLLTDEYGNFITFGGDRINVE